MRRRQVRYAQPESERPALLLMAAGAIAGAAAGLYLGRRYRTLDALFDDVRDRFGALREAWAEDDELEDEQRSALRSRLDVGDEDAVEDGAEDEIEPDGVDEDEDEDAGLEGWAAQPDDDGFDDEPDDLVDDETEDDLASVTGANGDAGALRTAERAARHLEKRVLETLRADRDLRSRAIEIAAVGDGVVELTGTVHAMDEISRAAAMVRKVPGVNMVLNRIEVRAAGHVDTASVPREPVGGEAADERTNPPV